MPIVNLSWGYGKVINLKYIFRNFLVTEIYEPVEHNDMVPSLSIREYCWQANSDEETNISRLQWIIYLL